MELKYSLAELPSSQHKAGLVGLLLMIDRLKLVSKDELVSRFTETEAVIRITEGGLKLLLDETYAATSELQGREAAYKGVEPEKIVEEIVHSKSGKERLKKIFYYRTVVPRGSFLETKDESESKIWIKLWRDMVWQILRGVPATRIPFEDRANGKTCPDTASLWKQLNQDINKPVDLPSTYFLGAQAFNAEKVPFKDNGRAQFLLHFWPYVCQIYIPQVVDRDGKRSFNGYALALPDVSLLDSFVSNYRQLLENRDNQAVGFRPKESIIEMPEEAGLDLIMRLNETISRTTAKQEISQAIFGIDIFHLLRDGNNVRLLYTGRVEPESKRDQMYATLKKSLLDHSFRRQSLINLLKTESWSAGFDVLLSCLPLDQGLCSPYFSHDAGFCFQAEKERNEEKIQMKIASAEPITSEDVCLESIVLKIVDGYLRQKLKDKYGLEWSKIHNETKSRAEYNDKREGVVKECFYAIRSRTGDDFINYFASNICSVPHWMTYDEYSCITKSLYADTDKVRTLSMLALSARVGRERKEDTSNE